MKIKITTTLNISKENEPLVQVIAGLNGYEDGDVNEFVKKLLADKSRETVRQIILSGLDNYFGVVMRDIATEKREALDRGSLISEVEITNQE